MVQTVLGGISANDLGHCQMHEHLFVTEGPATLKFPALLIDDEEKSAQELIRYRAAGGRTVLDCQPGLAGRKASALKRISKVSGVNIITCTGFHLPHFYPEDSIIRTGSEEALYGLFAGELANGCAEDPSVKPGAVKAALGKDGCEGQTEVCFRAAARAAANARVPLVVHTEKGVGALKAITIAVEAGVPRQKILICHVDRQANDFAPHDEIAATGVMMEYDTVGRFKYHDDASEIALLKHMIEKGHEDRLLISLDTTNERLGTYNGSITLNYILETFMPMMAANGISESLIRKITAENPKRVFE